MVTSTRDAQEDVVFFNDTATTEIYTLSLHDALPIFAQLWHPGRQQLWAPVMSPKGISDQPDAYSWTVPHVMSTDELRQVADEYVAVAQTLKRCGFGGAELHGAHGYLITQILSPWSNRRTDAYGGSLENRVRFVREVAETIRQSCGGD